MTLVMNKAPQCDQTSFPDMQRLIPYPDNNAYHTIVHIKSPFCYDGIYLPVFKYILTFVQALPLVGHLVP